MCVGHAQRVVHPNGTRSRPFIAPLSKLTMIAFAKQVLEGYWPKPASEFKECERDDLGTARIEGVFGGGFRRTLELWGLHGDYSAMMNVHGRLLLSYGDVLIAFLELGEGGACNTFNAMKGDGDNIHVALAKTTIEWAKRIEEWAPADGNLDPS